MSNGFYDQNGNWVPQAAPKRRFERNPLDEPAKSAGDLTHGEDKDHTRRLTGALDDMSWARQWDAK